MIYLAPIFLPYPGVKLQVLKDICSLLVSRLCRDFPLGASAQDIVGIRKLELSGTQQKNKKGEGKK
jgi:hypothetical protein